MHLTHEWYNTVSRAQYIGDFLSLKTFYSLGSSVEVPRGSKSKPPTSRLTVSRSEVKVIIEKVSINTIMIEGTTMY